LHRTIFALRGRCVDDTTIPGLRQQMAGPPWHEVSFADRHHDRNPDRPLALLGIV
jgi:hypothetical protein